MAENTTTTLSGIFKRVYGPSISNLTEPDAIFQRLVKFDQRNLMGDGYQIPVELTFEHGYTVGGTTGDAFTLNGSIAGDNKQARVVGVDLVHQGSISLKAAGDAASKGDRAFVQATAHVVQRLMKSSQRLVEILSLHGDEGIAKLDSGDVAGTYTAGSPGTAVVDAGAWAPGIWAGAEGMQFDIYDSTGATQRNSTALVVVSTDYATRTISWSGTTTTNIAADDVVWLYNSKGKEPVGLMKQSNNTGTLFGIDASVYSKWEGNEFSAGSAALTAAKLIKATSDARNRGALNTDAEVFISPVTWAALQEEVVGLRSFDTSYKMNEAPFGHSTFLFETGWGKLRVHAHRYMKEGEGVIFPATKCRRVGNQDISFDRAGAEGRYFFDLETKAGYEMRTYTNQAPFCEAISQLTRITNIVNP